MKAVKKPGGPRSAYMDGFCRQVSNVNRACYFLQAYKYRFLICVGFQSDANAIDFQELTV